MFIYIQATRYNNTICNIVIHINMRAIAMFVALT